MAHTGEPSEPPNTVPAPELNPLQNPLLAENMNRWAEVYFTNPPDRRDAAVVELLQELVEEKQRRNGQQRRPVMVPVPQSDRRSGSVNRLEEITYCPACRTENPVTHQFCGNCGQRLNAENQPATDSRLVHGEPNNRELDAAADLPEAFIEQEAARDETQEYMEDASEQEQDSAPYTPPFSSSDLSLFQSLRVPDDVEEEDWEYGGQRPGTYRYYIAVVLAIVIVGLGYLAWRGAQTSQARNEASAPPPVPVAESAQPSGPAATEKSESAQPSPSQPAAAKKAAQPSDSNEPSASKTNEPAKSEPVVKASETKRIPGQADTARTVASGNGAEELAMAQSYLTGSAGRGRDGSEAARWLWKSVSKHNGQATLMLADLYLRGDGVSKNCEQGRILLDSAAQRGIRGAGERLRNLQAFGCH